MLTFLTFLGASAWLLGAGPAQDRPAQRPKEPTPIRIEVEAVNVLVTVTTKEGRFVTDIDPSRFTVFEDKVLQKITNFRRDTELPLMVALLIDTSLSVRLQLDFEKQAATAFLYEVMRLQDSAMLVEFDTGATLLHDFTNKTDALAKEIRALRSGGGTALFDALCKISAEKLAEGSARKAVVVVSDGADLHSRHTLEDALAAVQQVGATIYAIGTCRFGATPEPGGEKKLTELTEKTGGRVFLPYSEDQFQQAFALINEELRSQYSITYVPANVKRDGKFRQIRVKVSDDKGLVIRHRRGYFAPLAPAAGRK
jgi:VWFA-related protein